MLFNATRQALSQIYRQTIFGYFHHGRRSSCIKKNRIRFAIDYKSPGFFRFETSFFPKPLAFRIATSYPRRGRSPNYSQRYEAWLLCSKWEQVYPSHHNHYTINFSYHISRYKKSGRRDSNPRPPPWQGDVLPLNYFRIMHGNVLPSQGAIPQLLSALWSLTSVFGMGTGISSMPSPPHYFLLRKPCSLKTRQYSFLFSRTCVFLVKSSTD